MSAAPVQLSAATSVVGRRVGAFVIDFLISGVVYWILFFLFAERQASEPVGGIKATLNLGDTVYAITGGKATLFFLIYFVAGLAYWAVLPGIRGFTVGKAVAGIRVVRADGTVPAGVGPNLLRQVVGIVDYFPYFLPGLVGFITALATPGHRRVGDMAAGTYVVSKEVAGRPLVADTAAPAAAAAPPAAAAPAAQPAAPTQPPPPQPAAASPPAATTAPAGWYADPRGEARLRYWDGQQWTGHTAP
jgi:uncharacterized RDD family membrane protein YckC